MFLECLRIRSNTKVSGLLWSSPSKCAPDMTSNRAAMKHRTHEETKKTTGLTEDLVVAEEANPNEGPELGGKQIGSRKLDYMLPVPGDLKKWRLIKICLHQEKPLQSLI